MEGSCYKINRVVQDAKISAQLEGTTVSIQNRKTNTITTTGGKFLITVRSGDVYGAPLGFVDPNTGKLTLTSNRIFIETRQFNNYLWLTPKLQIDINKIYCLIGY